MSLELFNRLTALREEAKTAAGNDYTASIVMRLIDAILGEGGNNDGATEETPQETDSAEE